MVWLLHSLSPWCIIALVIESKTHRITRHLRSEITAHTGVLARDEGVFFMSNDVFELKLSAQAFCRRNKIEINRNRLMRIIRKVIKRAEHEQKRLERVEITTPDGYSFIDYQDPTGESAVRNIMREIIAG